MSNLPGNFMTRKSLQSRNHVCKQWQCDTDQWTKVKNGKCLECRRIKRTRLTRPVPLVEKELPTLPEHLSSSPVFSGVRVIRYLALCVCFVYVVCPFVLFYLAIVLLSIRL